jgi:hypothetical protein
MTSNYHFILFFQLRTYIRMKKAIRRKVELEDELNRIESMSSPNKYNRNSSSPSSPRSPRNHAAHSPRALYLDKVDLLSSSPPQRLRKGESSASFQERPGSFKESLSDVNPNLHNSDYYQASRGEGASSPPARGRTLRRGDSTLSFKENENQNNNSRGGKGSNKARKNSWQDDNDVEYEEEELLMPTRSGKPPLIRRTSASVDRLNGRLEDESRIEKPNIELRKLETSLKRSEAYLNAEKAKLKSMEANYETMRHDRDVLAGKLRSMREKYEENAAKLREERDNAEEELRVEREKLIDASHTEEQLKKLKKEMLLLKGKASKSSSPFKSTAAAAATSNALIKVDQEQASKDKKEMEKLKEELVKLKAEQKKKVTYGHFHIYT